MNIAFFITSLRAGGAEKQLITDINLLKEDVNNLFIIYYYEGEFSNNIGTIKKIKLKSTNYISSIIEIRKIIRKYKINVLYSNLYRAMVISAIASIFVDIKVVWDFHFHLYDVSKVHYFLLYLLSKLKKVKKLIFVCHELKKYYENRNLVFPKSKLEVIYNSTELNYNPNEISNKKNKEIIIGYVGRIVKLKRVFFLLELVEYLLSENITNFKVQIIGEGEDRKFLEQYVTEHKLTNYVQFLGFQSNVEKFYSCFDLFILPSREECLPISLINAGVSGIPSIAFDVGGNNEIIINEITGFIVSNKEEMFKKAALLIQDSNLRKKMGKESVNYCCKVFDKENRRKKLLDLIINIQ